jgi:hypothetical protein
VLAYLAVEPPQHYHLAADHQDPILIGTELGLVLALLFVGGRLVACRLLPHRSNGSSLLAAQ